MFDSIFQIIEKSIKLSNKDKELCEQFFEPVIFPKNRVIEQEGKIPRYLYFINNGFLRLFYYNEIGEEVTTHLNCPPGFITSYHSFNNQEKSINNLECITECELLRISKGNLDLLLQQSEAFKDFSIWVFQQSLAYNENRSIELATLTAEERYLKLIKNYPEILHNVPLQYIASFLGMNPKSLSRIRNQTIR
ncbi:Crp/Fnr family transcriptional regulator [Flavobacterium sp.]|uniref:Crp/Fnr family transcriptional regulator n=1 Tax=Flavobacterium sp. TaxID=239 RepID=UPI0026125D85|nr:Crp/Fnr family transcriptional regulator [Flavobacterium sp.]